MSIPRSSESDALRVWLAMLTVYIVWGSTYLAIRIVVTDLPPLVTAGTRFLIAGVIVALAVLVRSGPLRLGRRQLAAAMLVGAALLLGGNGLVVIAEQTVPSAFTALMIASTPLWVVVFRWIFRERIARGTLVGVVVGFAGVACLVVPAWTGGAADPLGVVLLLLAAFSWACGSFISSRATMPRDPFASTAIQMLTGGAPGLQLVAASHEPETWAASADAFLAWLYLIFIGSLAGFTAYTWVLQHAPISRVATYAYVNPVVAVILGVVILGEIVTPAMLLGGGIIVAAVALIIRNESVQRRLQGTIPPAVTVEEIGCDGHRRARLGTPRGHAGPSRRWRSARCGTSRGTRRSCRAGRACRARPGVR
jgi:drug/metabolite transporter (DMT)-like permease